MQLSEIVKDPGNLGSTKDASYSSNSEGQSLYQLWFVMYVVSSCLHRTLRRLFKLRLKQRKILLPL